MGIIVNTRDHVTIKFFWFTGLGSQVNKKTSSSQHVKEKKA